MSEIERLLQECERYLRSAEGAFNQRQFDRAIGYGLLAVERYHQLIPLSPPLLAKAHLSQVDSILGFIERAKDSMGKSRQLENGPPETSDGLPTNPWLVRGVPKVSDEDVIGMTQLKDELQLFIDKFQHPEIVARWKGARRGNRIILWGPPGTGKTFFARYVASKINAAFYQVKASSLLSKWVGESQKNVVKLFEAVEGDERAVVFMDEIDGVLGKRGSNSTVRDGVVSEFLQSMDGLTTTDRSLFFIGATNRPFDLDEAAISRFGMMVYVPLPDFEVRVTFLRKVFDDLPEGHDEAVSPEDLALRFEGHSMRDLERFKENLADGGIRKSVRHQSAKVTLADVQQAISRIAPPLSPQEIRRYENMVSNQRENGR